MTDHLGVRTVCSRHGHDGFLVAVSAATGAAVAFPKAPATSSTTTPTAASTTAVHAQPA